MATTNEQAQEESQAFADAFAQEDSAKHTPSDDEVFGLGAEAAEPAAAEAVEPVQEAAASESTESAVGPTNTDAAESQPASESAPDAAVVITPEVAEDEPTDPKELQRKKSWEGRLRAKEAELKAREEALKGDAPGDAADHPSESGEPAVQEAAADAVEAVSEQVESGEMTVDQAMAALGNDFGPDFTKMLGVLIKSQAQEIATKLADEKVGTVRQEVDGLVNEIVDGQKREHFELISDAHPDFMDVAGSPEFKAYVDSLPGSEQQAAQQVIESGSARQINKLLTAFKQAKVVEPDDTQAIDDAEGVRSGGLKIPEKPVESTNYEDAWNEF